MERGLALAGVGRYLRLRHPPAARLVERAATATDSVSLSCQTCSRLLFHRQIAPLNKERKVSRPVIDSDDSECEVLGVATPAVHQAPFNNVKVEPTAPSSQIADGNGRAIRGGDAGELRALVSRDLTNLRPD